MPFERLQKSSNNGRVVTVEDHYGGSFGSAVADALAAHGNYCHVKQMYVRKPPKSARTPEELLRYLGLSADDIVNVASRVLEESRHPVGN